MDMTPLTKRVSQIIQLVAAQAVLIGCTHVPLRKNTLHQAQAVHQIQQQQVLDNLAMFASDPNAVPFFTVVGAGTSAITDSGSASTALGWLRTGFQSVGLTISGNRVMQENFTLGPLNEPDALARMRCTYQAAVGYSGSRCIDCCSLEEGWGNTSWDGLPAPEECPHECSFRPGWFCVGCKCDVPKDACYVGRYGDTYVWVPPAGSDELARLTLTILDYATGLPPATPTKTVKRVTKYPADASGIERTIEETLVVHRDFEIDASQARDPSLRQAEPLDMPAPARRNFFVPQQPLQLVVPVL